jgi:thiol-disulfide isomerase/thioredoxin
MLLVCQLTFGQAFLKTDSVYIIGKVTNYEKHTDSANAVSIIVDDMASGQQLTYRGKINSTGIYKIHFLKTGPQDIMLLYGDDIVGIIVSPGNHMQIDFDADNFTKTLVFTGDDSQTNRDLITYQATLDKRDSTLYGEDIYARSKTLSTSQKDAQPEDYKKFVLNRYASESLYLDEYIKQRKLSPKFIKWARADLKYDALENLFRYTWLHPMYNKIKEAEFKLPDTYYNFINTTEQNDASFSISTHFGNFLKEYKGYFVRKNLGSSWRTGADVELYLKQPAGIAKDVMLCITFYNNISSKYLDVLRPYLNRFKNNVITPGFKSAILNAYNQADAQLRSKSLPVNAQVNQGPKTEADSLFSKIIEKYPNKAIYVDIWATWCAPCRAEMPNARKLREHFAGKDVVFVYLCVQSEKQTWKAMIADLYIQGEHFLLSKNEYGALAEKFQISGIPRYLLLDKNGHMIDDNAKRPGDAVLQSDIQRLLAIK